jgi:hypothetical protein
MNQTTLVKIAERWKVWQANFPKKFGGQCCVNWYR